MKDFVKILMKYDKCKEFCNTVPNARPEGCRVISRLCWESEGLEKLLKLLRVRDELIGEVMEFEKYALWKKKLLEKYVKKYGLGRFKIKHRVRLRTGNYVTYMFLGFERYEDSKVIVVKEENALDNFIKYVELLRKIRLKLTNYQSRLDEIMMKYDGLTRRIAKKMLDEVKTLRKRLWKLRKLEEK